MNDSFAAFSIRVEKEAEWKKRQNNNFNLRDSQDYVEVITVRDQIVIDTHRQSL